MHNPVIANSFYDNYSAIKVTISIPPDFKNLASLTMGRSEQGMQEITFNAVDGMYQSWFQEEKSVGV